MNNKPTQKELELEIMELEDELAYKKEQDVTTVCNVPKFHGQDVDYLDERVTLELGQKIIRI